MKASIGAPRVTPAASGLEPAYPMSIAFDASAAMTLAPESNFRHSILSPVAFS